MKNFLSLKNIIRYFFAIFIVVNLIACYFIFQFGHKYVYQTFYFDESSFFSDTSLQSKGINLIEFEKAIKSLQDKTGVYSYSIIKSIEEDDEIKEIETDKNEAEEEIEKIESEEEEEELGDEL